MGIFVAPQTDNQKIVCNIFEKVLGIAQVGINDDFFALGATSDSVAVAAKLLRKYGVSSADIVDGKTPEIIARNMYNMTDFYENSVQGKSKAPLTDSQLGIYLEYIASPESLMYNNPFELIFSGVGELTCNEIKARIDDVIRLHPALYAHFETDEDTVYMVKDSFPADGICRFVDELDYTCKPFNLSESPLCRLTACKDGDKLSVFIEAHHAVQDGTSASIIAKQICESLAGITPNGEIIDAFSVCEAEEKIFKSELNKKSMEYFENLLSDADTDACILPDFKAEDKKIYPVCSFKKKLDTSKAEKLLADKNITNNTLFMGAFGYTLMKYSGSESVVLTMAESGRKSELLKNSVSMFVKTIPIVIRPDEEKSGTEFLTALQLQINDSIANDNIAVSNVFCKFGIKTDNAFVYQSGMFSSEKCGNISYDISVKEAVDALGKISCMIFKGDNGFELKLDYRSDLYKKETIENFAATYQLVLDSILDDVAMKDIKLINDEQEKLLDSFNSTAEVDDSITFVSEFRKNCKKHGNRTALVFKDKKFTYDEFDEITDKLAVYFSKHGITKNSVVSVIIPRCENMAIISVAVLKAGAIYEPLDPNYPPERLNFMCSDAKTKLLVANRELAPIVSEYKGDILYTDEIDAILSDINADEAKNIPAPRSEDIYILLYTSGTTGTPKGCMLSHGNLMAFIKAYSIVAEISDNSKITSYASYGFDAHMCEIYPALANFGELYIIPDEIRLNFPELRKFIEENNITNTFMTTQVARQFAAEFVDIKCLKHITTGGEKLMPYPLSENFSVINCYGPTECTVCVTTMTVEKEYDDIPIGKPMLNNHIFVADKYGRRLPAGVPGELIICGPQVGKGYLNRREQTEKVFVPNTYEKNPDSNHLRCYKSGDVVRYLYDGNIQYIGRRDLQVKIRGYRIELSEVEKIIREYPDITDATVIAVDDNGGKAIHAYIVSPKKIEIAELEKFIKSKKPAYMVPAAAMQIESIPLTVNHKVDKRKLPPIEKTKQKAVDTSRQMTKLEKSIADILKDIIGESNFGVEDEFVDLGITSISSIKLSTKIYKKFGVNISSSDILDGGSILTVENIIISELLQSKTNASEEKKQILQKYPLTQVQMGIYLDCMRSGMDTYNIPIIYALPNGIDISRLKGAIISAVKAHPSMLCHIYADENGDVAVYPVPDMPIEVFEEKTDVMPPKSADFNFEKAPLFKFSITQYNGNLHLFIQAHHIIADGESMTVLLDDINKAYCGENITAEEYSVFSLSLDEQSARSGEAFGVAKSYYDSVFSGISADYMPIADRNEDLSFGATDYHFDMSPNEVQDFCNKNNITKNIFFTGVFALTLAKFTSHEDAFFTTIYNGRTDPRTERLVGMLVKTLPIFVQAEPDNYVSDYFNRIESQIKQLRKYDIFSFADSAREYGINADIMFIYQGRMLMSTKLGDKILEPVPVKNSTPKAELAAEVFEDDASYSINFEYNAGHFSTELINSFADAYATCAASILNAEKLSEIEITSKDAFAKFDSFNDTAVDVPFEPIYRLIEKQAELHPNKSAVVARPENSDCGYEKLTYNQLNNMSNCIAHELINLGIKPGTPVALMTGRTKEVIIAEHGILKAGCAFLFLSPSYPDDRIEYIAQESEISAVVTTHKYADSRKQLFENLGLNIIYADDIDINISCENTDITVSPDSLAYLIYTSGSTGKPKGVMVKQKGIVNLSDNNSKNIHMNYYYTDVAAVAAAFTFDASVVGTICNFVYGSTVCIASDNDMHNPKAFTELCLDNGVTSFCATPSFILSLLEYDEFIKATRQLQAIVAGGEAFPSSLYEKLHSVNPDMRIINGYGPSETTIACTAKLLDSPNHITIGTPLNNYKIYIIDKQNHILPMGSLGELVILGDGVGKGYLNRDELTKKSFIKILGEDAYKSGDLALITHSGEIEFHGRIDNQVKLRGLRIELGEIESAINSCDGVKTCIVTVNGADNNKFLAAYYTAEREISSSEITEQISKTLAEYMIPRVFIQLDTMPLTANGKINKKELPEPVTQASVREYVAPTTDTEKLLCEAFSKALNIEKIGINDDFFELGGTSLTATKVAMFGMAHGINIAYKDVFTNPTVHQLAMLCGVAENSNDDNSFDDDYSDTQKALSKNVWSIGDDAGTRPLGNVLITGATGFLGIHILKEFLDNEDGDVYCLLRSGSFTSSELKLAGMFIYYFDTSIEDLIGKRIHCIDGDITDRENVMSLKNIPFDTLINCAACVKHFTNSDILDKVNVEGVKNLVDLCAESGKRLIHISTISVAGEGMGNKPERNKVLHENELYFNQILENQYIVSKFRSEKIVLDAVAHGLDGKIMRAGNLMPRYSDGEFQINYMTNGFMRRLRGYAALGCIPYSHLSGELEFSPIDETARAMLSLAKTDSRFSVFHANNVHRVFISDVIRAMNKADINVECVDENEFVARLKAAMDDSSANDGVSGLIAYLNRDTETDRYMLDYDNSFTASVLNRIGFNWNITNDEYIVNSLRQINMLGFFDR